MEKKLTFALILAAAMAPARLFALTQAEIDISTGAKLVPPASVAVSTWPGGSVILSSRTAPVAPTGADQIHNFARPPRKPIHELADTMETSEDAKRTKSTLKLLDGTANGKTAYKLAIPKDGHWRLLWEFAATDPKEQGKLIIRVDSPSDKEFLQELTKSVKMEEDPYGTINVCAATGGDFNLEVTSYKTKWHIEVQLLK